MQFCEWNHCIVITISEYLFANDTIDDKSPNEYSPNFN